MRHLIRLGDGCVSIPAFAAAATDHQRTIAHASGMNPSLASTGALQRTQMLGSQRSPHTFATGAVGGNTSISDASGVICVQG